MSGTATNQAVSEAPRVSVILCGTSNDDVTWANEAFAKRKDVALSVHLQRRRVITHECVLTSSQAPSVRLRVNEPTMKNEQSTHTQ